MEVWLALEARISLSTLLVSATLHLLESQLLLSMNGQRTVYVPAPSFPPSAVSDPSLSFRGARGGKEGGGRESSSADGTLLPTFFSSFSTGCSQANQERNLESNKGEGHRSRWNRYQTWGEGELSFQSSSKRRNRAHHLRSFPFLLSTPLSPTPSLNRT